MWKLQWVPEQNRLSPCGEEWLKRLSHWKGQVRQRQAPESKVTSGKQRVETEPEIPRQSLWWTQKASWDVQRELVITERLQKREFSGIKDKGGKRKSEAICLAKEPHLGGTLLVLLGCLVLEKLSPTYTLSLQHRIIFSSAMEKPGSFERLWHLDKW